MTNANISKFPIDNGYYKLDGEKLGTNEEYRMLIGKLLYLATNTRPDSVSILSKRVAQTRNTDLNEVKKIVRYLKGTKIAKLCLSNKKEMKE
jgi:hypothetical protein